MFYHPITTKILIAKKNSNKIDGSNVRHKNPQLALKMERTEYILPIYFIITLTSLAPSLT